MTKLKWDRNRRDKKQWSNYFDGLVPFLSEQSKLIEPIAVGSKSKFDRDEMRTALELLNSLIQSKQFGAVSLSFRSSIILSLKDVLEEYELFDCEDNEDPTVNKSLLLFDQYRILLAIHYGLKNLKNLAQQARRGNYKPFSSVIVAALGAEFEIKNRVSFDKLYADLERLKIEKRMNERSGHQMSEENLRTLGIEQIDSLIRFVDKVNQSIAEIEKI